MIEDDVDTPLLRPCSNFSTGLLIRPCRIGSQSQAACALLLRRGGHSNLRAVQLGDLNGVHAYARGAGLDEDLVAWLYTRSADQHVPSGQETQRCAGGQLG